MLGQLLNTASFGALKSCEFMAATALLTEALQFSSSKKLLLLDMDFADMAPLVVGAKMAQVFATSLHLASGLRLPLTKG